MKKIILSLAIALSFAQILIAQDNKTDYRSKFMFGPKGGVNYSNVYDSKGEEFKANGKFGAVAGLFIVIPISKFFGIQPEVLFSQKGFQATGIILDNGYNFTRTTNYIDVPLLFSFKISEFISLNLGPQYSYLIKQKDVFKNASTSVSQETAFQNDDLRQNTLCLLGGADITLKHIVLGLRAGLDFQNNNKDGSSLTPRYKNTWLQFTVGYRFY